MKGDVSVKVAAEFFRTSESTIRRKCGKPQGFPNAYQLGGDNSSWHIPVGDLLKTRPDQAESHSRLEELIKVSGDS